MPPETRSWRLVLAAMMAYLALMLHGGMAWSTLRPAAIGTALQPLLINDVICFWSVAQMLAIGQAAATYTDAALFEWQFRLVPGFAFPQPWQYPPLAFPLVLPLGWLPFWLAQVVQSVGLLSLGLWALRPILPRNPLTPLAVACFGGLVASFWIGQNTILIAALFALAYRAPTQTQAGVYYGLMAFKPHFAVLVPVFLLSRRQYHAFGVAAAVVVAQVALSLALWGAEPWLAFWHKITAPVDILPKMLIEDTKLISLYAQLRVIGVTHEWAMRAQCLWVVGLAVLVWRYRGSDWQGMAVLVSAAALAPPYASHYDLILLAVPAALVLARRAAWRDLPLWALVWLGGVLSPTLAHSGVLTGFWAAMAMLFLSLRGKTCS